MGIIFFFHNGTAGTGEKTSLNSIDTHIKNFEFHLKYLTPSDQITCCNKRVI